MPDVPFDPHPGSRWCPGGVWGRPCPCGKPRRKQAPGTSYYERTADGRGLWAGCHFLVAWFGAHLICPRRGCRRARRCTDRDRTRLPRCFGLYRGEMRFALKLHERPGATAPRDVEEWPEEVAYEGPTVLGLMAEAGAPIDALRRPADWHGEEWTWERDPEAVAMLQTMREAVAEMG